MRTLGRGGTAARPIWFSPEAPRYVWAEDIHQHDLDHRIVSSAYMDSEISTRLHTFAIYHMMVVPIQSTAWGLGHWNRVLSPCGDHT